MDDRPGANLTQAELYAIIQQVFSEIDELKVRVRHLEGWNP